MVNPTSKLNIFIHSLKNKKYGIEYAHIKNLWYLIMSKNKDLIINYYDYFNKKDWDALSDLLDENIIHDRNQENRVIGQKSFHEFLIAMGKCYDETISDLAIFEHSSNERFATEFTVDGSYIKTDINLPPATGQKYRLSAGAFFQVNNGKITRVTGYYNLNEWINLIKE